MSLTAALSIARSGLTVSSRAAEMTSQNVANALTEGYGLRELALSSRMTGGVAVTGVTRFADRALIGDRRIADAGAAADGSVAAFLSKIEKSIGTTGAGSLGGMVSGLETALIDAASQPQSDARLAAVVSAGGALAGHVRGITDQTQGARQDAETGIASAVDEINAALKQLEDLNARIAVDGSQGRDVGALLDQRQQTVDRIAQHVPLREIDRGNGQIALMTKDGAMLLDGKAAQLGFQKAGVIVPGMSVESGALSGLTLNGQPLPLSGAGGAGGGNLAAQFAIRDTLAPEAQAALDTFDADLRARFAGTGLFTGEAAAEPWRLRDGLDAAAPGAGGDASRLNGMLSGMAGLSAAATEVLSGVSTKRVTAEAAAAFSTARADTLRVAELQGGVDTDTEMQKLLMIEQAYAANAKVIQTVDAMMQALLGI
ncbi:flagellar hook-associated protein FlgK [Cereibacter sp. SYSU M97828]|nr:flagellar hook-associated protein FlgK [Cereibacter flavus]